MNRHLFAAASVLTLGLLSSTIAKAHYLWIERSGNQATVYFGEYEESARERSPGRLDEIPGPQGSIIATGQTKTVALTRLAHGLAFPRSVPAAAALLVEDDTVGVKDWTQYGHGIVKPYFYARHQALDADTGPALPLDILPQSKRGTFKVFFLGQPLPRADVKIVAPNTWSQEGRTGEDGSVALPLPWKGQYVLQVTHTERVPGEHDGKAFAAKRHRATLTIFNPRGAATFAAGAKP